MAVEVVKKEEIRESRRRFLTAAGSSLLLTACAMPPSGGELEFVGTQADINGAKLYYSSAGQGAPIVFLHAFMLDQRMWDAQFHALASHFRVIRYDLRGFGRSSLPDPAVPYSHRDDLRALLVHLNLKKAHLVGASMGGRIALDFALAYPEFSDAIALLDPVLGGWEWSPTWLSSYGNVVRAAQRGDIAAAKAAWLSHPIFATARTNPELYTRLRQMVNDYSGWHFTHADPARELSPVAARQLNRLRGPLLTIVGERDLPDFQNIAQRLERDARSQRVSLPGVGHLCGMEAPERVNERLISFFKAAV
ncbi:MAG TPA: alpha/beta hydrolase [Burkholderiales bacterium]|nr:alpha/beta hydrolase [Burkholderiales bacterium]